MTRLYKYIYRSCSAHSKSRSGHVKKTSRLPHSHATKTDDVASGGEWLMADKVGGGVKHHGDDRGGGNDRSNKSDYRTLHERQSNNSEQNHFDAPLFIDTYITSTFSTYTSYISSKCLAEQLPVPSPLHCVLKPYVTDGISVEYSRKRKGRRSV